MQNDIPWPKSVDDAAESHWNCLRDVLVESWKGARRPGAEDIVRPNCPGIEARYLRQVYSKPLAEMDGQPFNCDDILGLSDSAVQYYLPFIFFEHWKLLSWPSYLLPEHRNGHDMFEAMRATGADFLGFTALRLVTRVAIRRIALRQDYETTRGWEEIQQRMLGDCEADSLFATLGVRASYNPTGDRLVLAWIRSYSDRLFAEVYLLMQSELDESDKYLHCNWVNSSIAEKIREHEARAVGLIAVQPVLSPELAIEWLDASTARVVDPTDSVSARKHSLWRTTISL